MTAYPKPAGRVRDSEHMARVRELPCILATSIGGCGGRMEANHVGPRAFGRKSNDDETIPMCSAHHDMWTRHLGAFYNWTKAMRRAWADESVVRTRAELARETVVPA